MNINEVRSIIRQTIAEAIEEKKGKSTAEKSGGKLVHLKKEMEGLKRMKESLGQLQISEGGDQQFVAEYAHMQKFVTEYNKIKEAHARLSEMLDNQIGDVDNKIKTETEKIKELMGLIDKAKKPAAKKAAKKDDKKEEPKEEKPKADDKKKSKELDEASYKVSPNSKEAQNLKKGDIITSGEEVVSVSAGAKTPSGKVEVTLSKDGKTRNALWGKSTKIGVKK